MRSALLRFARWVIRRYTPDPTDLEICGAVSDACRYVGMNVDTLTPETNLLDAGKVYDVLHHAAHALQKDHELRTVQDVIDWLAEAPRRIS